MRLVAIVTTSYVCLQLTAIASQAQPSLSAFIEQRLKDKADASPPSFEALLKSVETIARSSRAEMEAALPLISSALKSRTNNLAVEAAFALSVIARRPDGGLILKNRVAEIADLLVNSDDRLSGGAAVTLGSMAQSIPDAAIPVMLRHLTNAQRPS